MGTGDIIEGREDDDRGQLGDDTTGRVDASPPPAQSTPVAPVDRVASIDVLRGVALMGILVMNIPSFAFPDSLGSPERLGTFQGWDKAIWIVQHIVFEEKMMTLFSMLFGAGLVLMADRAERSGAGDIWRRRYVRRVLGLMVIGAIHGYLIWDGDILFWYGACGLIIGRVRDWPARRLIAFGLGLNLVITAIALPVGVGIFTVRAIAREAEAVEARGGTIARWQNACVVITRSIEKETRDDPAEDLRDRQEEVAIYRGGYLGIVKNRAPFYFAISTVGLAFFGVWLCGGRMLIGMGLMKLGLFTGDRSTRFAFGLMAMGYGLGMPPVLLSTWYLIHDHFGVVSEILDVGVFNHLGSLGMAIGHAALIVLAYRSGWFSRPFRAVGAIGRMALTNYLMQSLILSTLFYGYGFGWFGRVDRVGQMGIVAAILAFQLTISPIWLRFFRYGPAEWAWRSFTYGAPQPMRVETS